MEHVSWTRMADGTEADYEFLGSLYQEHADEHLVPTLIMLMQTMAGDPLGYQIDRYQHSLQSGTRALRAGESVDMVVGALLHDVGDAIAPENHSALAAAVLRPYVDDRTHWVVQHHGLFQGYYYFHHMGGDRNGRDVFAAHEFYDDCVQFCEEYDQNCFDPNYDTLPIEAFRPMLDEVFSRPSRINGIAPIGMTADTAVN